MSISSRITSMEEHIGNAYQGLQNIGVDITGVNKNIENISSMLEEAYKEAPKVSDTGTDITLDNTRKGRVDMGFSGNTSQETTTGKNLLSIPNMTNTHNGITFDLVDYNIMSFSGTATGSWANLNASNLVDNPMISGQTYTFSIDATQNVRVVLYETSPQTAHVISEGNKSVTFQASGADNIFIGITNLTTNTNYNGIVKMQLELGNTATDWEEYSGGIASPNPDYPQDIHVVSGDNSIEVCGKNILKYPYLNTTSIVSGVTFTDNGDGSITINGTSTSSTYSLWFLYENAWNYNNLSFELNSGTYTFKGLTTNKVTMACNFYFSDNSNEYFSIAQNDVTKTITNKVRLNMRILVNGGTTVDNVTIYPQIEVGSSSSSFEPYNGNTYPINLGVKNLFDKSTANLNKGVATANGGLYNSDINFSTDYIEVKTNGTYYTASGVSSVANRVYGAQYDSNKQYVGAISTNVGQKTFYISNANVKYIRLTGLLEEIDTYQIEEGSKQNNFTPYGTTPIELAEISTYNDEIFRTSGKNLCNGTNQNVYLNNDVNRCGVASGDSGLYIPVNGGQYTISTLVTQTRYRVACSNDIPPSVSSVSAYNGQNKDNTSNSITINTTGYNYLIVNATDLSAIQIEKGTTATEYNPYGTGEWYYKEAIKKIVLDGTETISAFDATSLSGSYQATFGITARATTTDKVAISDKFISALLSDRTTKTNIIYSYSDGYLRIATNVANTMAGFKTWLGTNNPKVLLEAATPTYNKITYEPLLEQLEAIYNAQGYDNQTNISQTNNDLPFKITASALKEWQESASLNSTLSMVNPLNLGNTLNTQEIENNTQPIEVDNIEPLEEEENE